MSHSFPPSPENARAFRDALGCFATGVTVITTATSSGPMGMTANSFSSVSLDPPLVLWALARDSHRFDGFAEAEHFAIHVLHDGQKELALDFARQGDAFGAVQWAHNARGVPVISDCLAAFECKAAGRHDGGDHVILLGEVETATIRDGAPLIFAQSGFGRFRRTL